MWHELYYGERRKTEEIVSSKRNDGNNGIGIGETRLVSSTFGLDPLRRRQPPFPRALLLVLCAPPLLFPRALPVPLSRIHHRHTPNSSLADTKSLFAPHPNPLKNLWHNSPSSIDFPPQSS